VNALAAQSLFALGITVLIVFRFARRELRERIVRARTLWIRPAIMIALTLYLVYLSAAVDPLENAEMMAVLIGGAVLGLLVGFAIVGNTQFAPAGTPNAVLVRGNRVTFAIWIAALAVRLAARYLLPHGADPRAQLPLNCGTIIMTTVAFVVIALAFGQAIRRYAGSIAAPETIVPGTITRQ
jgi:peptidoglycan/LPS O-acetylase OafA/YrhL